MTVVCWDIDGTLLTTGRAGIFAWEEALHEVTGVQADLASFDTAGVPDFGIARRLLQDYAGSAEPDDATVRRLVTAYEDRLPQALPRRTGRVLPNVRAILSALAARPEIRCTLLTGNTRRGAAAKLQHYGLAHFFDNGAFSDGELDRNGIAQVALAQARAARDGLDPARVFVVGDTPHDVRCGQAIGARVIAVATGGYPEAELAAAEPWKVLAGLPAPDAFLALLDQGEVVMIDG